MKVTEWFCNLCREKKEVKELKTLFYKSDILPQQYVLLSEDWNKSDKHICNNCIEIIKQSKSK